MYTNFVAEFVGTFVFLLIILQSGAFGILQPFVIAAGLLAAIFMMGGVSGGHFNPAVTAMKHFNGSPEVAAPVTAAGYVAAQVLGGLFAANVQKML
jgi:aquaporin Z